MKTFKLKNSSKRAYLGIISSIAFYPALISFGCLALAVLFMYLDEGYAENGQVDQMWFLIVKDADTARSLLSALLGGLISLTVFSFSMVMVVLSQTAANYSPRVLPVLVSKNENQIVLGIYLGTICYTAIVLSNIDSSSDLTIPVFSIIVNILLVFGCLVSFVFFIHVISNEIQIGNILNQLNTRTKRVLYREINSNSYKEYLNPESDFFPVEAWESGYFDSITVSFFLKGAEKYGLKTKLLRDQGIYLLKGDLFLEINQPLTQEIKELLMENFIFRHQERISENYVYGFKQITEVAVKALSPGINDPGTALQAINYLTDLFRMLLKLRGHKVIENKEGDVCLIFASVPFEEIFYMCLASIRAYSAQDPLVQSRLVDLIAKMMKYDEREKYHSLFEKELKAIEEASAKAFKSSRDVDFLRESIKRAKTFTDQRKLNL